MKLPIHVRVLGYGIRAIAFAVFFGALFLGTRTADWYTPLVWYLGYQFFWAIINAVVLQEQLQATDRAQSEADLAGRVAKQGVYPEVPTELWLNPKFQLKKLRKAFSRKQADRKAGTYDVWLIPFSRDWIGFLATRFWRTGAYGYMEPFKKLSFVIQDMLTVLAIILLLLGEPAGLRPAGWSFWSGMRVPNDWIYSGAIMAGMIVFSLFYSRWLEVDLSKRWHGWGDAFEGSVLEPFCEENEYGWIATIGLAVMFFLAGYPATTSILFGVILALPLFVISHPFEETSDLVYYAVSRTIFTGMLLFFGFPKVAAAHIIFNGFQYMLSFFTSRKKT